MRQGATAMSAAHLSKQLRALSYTEMKAVAGEIAGALLKHQRDDIDATLIADVLTRLEGDARVDALSVAEEKILREIFSRKRAVAISRAGNGWQIEIASMPGSHVTGLELRPMFSMMLDQIITMHALTAK